MNSGSGESVTELLARVAAGDDQAAEAVFPLVYDELHGIAQHLMSRERGDHTLQTTALVNEAWLRLGGANAENRDHFVRLAARAMRRVLVDHARKRNAAKRQGQRAQPLLTDVLEFWDDRQVDLLALDEALERLGERDEDVLRVVELRFFSGLTLAEVGQVMGMSERKAGLAWTFARGWLRRELQRGGAHDA